MLLRYEALFFPEFSPIVDFGRASHQPNDSVDHVVRIEINERITPTTNGDLLGIEDFTYDPEYLYDHCPLAAELFELKGVVGVVISSYHVYVQKTHLAACWDTLMPQILDVINRYFNGDKPDLPDPESIRTLRSEGARFSRRLKTLVENHQELEMLVDQLAASDQDVTLSNRQAALLGAAAEYMIHALRRGNALTSSKAE